MVNITPATALLQGLRELSAASFPKRCATCGQTYLTAQAFIEQTRDISGHSGLKSSFDDDDQPIVDLFRNCTCGSTLMDSFQDRRQVNAQSRRQTFERMLALIENEGLERTQARAMLLGALAGINHPMLTRLGIKLDRNS